MNNLLHIFGQQGWHDNAYIIGDKEALTHLRNAIDEAIQNGIGSFSSFVNDGEGFKTAVMSMDNEKLMKLQEPYNEAIAQDNREESIKPWQIQEIIEEIRKKN